MNLVKEIIAGLVAALVGVVIWVAIGYYANAEVGYVAWGIGFLAGLGVRFAAGSEKEGFLPGGVAVAIAVVAILGAKFAVASLLVEKHLAEAMAQSDSVTFSEEDGIAEVAIVLVEAQQAAGKTVPEPSDAAMESDTRSDDYPPAIWAEAQKKWGALSADEKASHEAKAKARFEEAKQMFVTMMRDGVVKEAFAASFGMYDLLWFGLAAFTAFKIGSGMAGSNG